MELWYFLFFGLFWRGIIVSSQIEPIEVYAPEISGVSSISVTDSYDDSFLLVFSGNTDVASYSSNMMIINEGKVQFSSTSDFPSDRSYYGMALVSELSFGINTEDAVVFGGIGPDGVLGDFWRYLSDYDYWYQLDMHLEESSYDFAYASFYDTSLNETRIFVVGGINNMNEYVDSVNEFVVETEKNNWFNDFTDCTEYGLAGAQLIISDNILYLFSGYFYSYDTDYVYFEDLCTLDISDTESSWTKPLTGGNLGKIVHGGSCLYNNKIYYFFGSHYGLDGITYRNQIYKLDLNDISNGWKDTGYSCPEGTDCARDSFGYACKDNNVTIIGGKTVNGATNSVFSIDLSSLETTDILNEKTFPSPRAFASLTQSSTKLLLFGGVNRGEIFDDIWEYDYDDDSRSGIWLPLTVTGSSPVPRYGHAATTQGVFTVFIGGVTTEGRILSDIWLLNLITNTWTELIPSETSNYKIPALTRTCAMLDLPKLYFVGGQSHSGSNFDIWEYDLSTNNLERIYSSKSEIGTHGHACQLIKDEKSSVIYTFYGMTNKMNDMYCSIRKINITETDRITVEVARDKPENVTCRVNFGYSYDGKYMVIVGGEVFPNIAMNDIIWINFIGDYEEQFSDPLLEPLSGSAVLAFSINVFIFSGFHDGSFSINSDLSSSLYLTAFTSPNCGYGFYKKGEECLPCDTGTYKPTYDGKCIECPPGTTHDLQAASHLTQCVPCPLGTFFDHDDTLTCVKCPEDTLCPVGSSVALNSTAMKLEQQSQPKNFNQPSMGWSMTILGSIFGFTILMFTIVFCSALLFKVILSVYDVYRAEHIIPRGETSYEEDKTKISFVGGFFTGLALILINFNFALFIINYVYRNEDEIRSLVPMISLVQEQDYSNNHLMLEIYMYSYRDDCSSPPHFTSSFFNLTYAYFDEEDVGNNMTACTHVLDVDFNTLFTTGASVDIELSEYTSDMSVTLYGKSGNPGASSSYTQVITPNDDSVFKGTDPSVFSFSLMPAYYSYRGLFGELSEYLGFRVSSFVAPEKGSLSSRENIYLGTGFKIQVLFIMSESGMTTYRFHQIDPISLVILMLASVPGLIGLCGSLVTSYERIYFLWKRIQVGFEGASVSEQYNKLRNPEATKDPGEDLGMNENEKEKENENPGG